MLYPNQASSTAKLLSLGRYGLEDGNFKPASVYYGFDKTAAMERERHELNQSPFPRMQESDQMDSVHKCM